MVNRVRLVGLMNVLGIVNGVGRTDEDVSVVHGIFNGAEHNLYISKQC